MPIIPPSTRILLFFFFVLFLKHKLSVDIFMISLSTHWPCMCFTKPSSCLYISVVFARTWSLRSQVILLAELRVAWEEQALPGLQGECTFKTTLSVCVYIYCKYKFIMEHFGFHSGQNPRLKCTWQWLPLSWLRLKHCHLKEEEESSRCCHQMRSTSPRPFPRCLPRQDLYLHLSPQPFCLPCQQPWL